MMRTLVSLALLVAYVLASTAGLTLMKQGIAAKAVFAPRFAGGFGLYVLGFGLWLLLLNRMPLSTAFPLAAGALIIATQAAGVLLLSERLAPAHMVGVALILAGLAVVLFSGAR